MELKDKIRYLRIQAGMSQSDLAERMNTTKQTICKYEKGVVDNLPLNRLRELASILGCSPAYLMGWEDEETDKPTVRDDELTAEQIELMNVIKGLSQDEVLAVLRLLKR